MFGNLTQVSDKWTGCARAHDEGNRSPKVEMGLGQAVHGKRGDGSDVHPRVFRPFPAIHCPRVGLHVRHPVVLLCCGGGCQAGKWTTSLHHSRRWNLGATFWLLTAVVRDTVGYGAKRVAGGPCSRSRGDWAGGCVRSARCSVEFDEAIHFWKSLHDVDRGGKPSSRRNLRPNLGAVGGRASANPSGQ